MMVLFRRAQAMDSGLKKAIEVPLSLMKLACGCWPHMVTLAQHGNITTLSDLKVMKSWNLLNFHLCVCLRVARG